MTMEEAATDPIQTQCTCAEIMANDESRHFKECPLRAKFPKPASSVYESPTSWEGIISAQRNDIYLDFGIILADGNFVDPIGRYRLGQRVRFTVEVLEDAAEHGKKEVEGGI